MAKKILLSGNKVITTSGGAITFDVKDEQEKTITPTANGVVVTPDTDYTLSKVTVNGDSNLTAGNIKKGVKIFGVTGMLESGTSSKIQPSKSLTITSNGTTTITPDASYDAIRQVGVTVNVATSGGGITWYDMEVS